MATGIVGGRPEGGPWHLEIHPTSKCNIDCFFCVSVQYAVRGDTILPWEHLKKLLEARAGGNLRMLRLSGGGEPLLYPSIAPLLELMARREIKLYELTTNGTLLKQAVPGVLAAGLELAVVSLNEATAPAYARTMQVPAKMFDRVLEGIAALREGARGLPPQRRPALKLQFFIHRENWRNILEIYRTGVELGADIVYLRTILNLPPERRIPAADYPEFKPLVTRLIEENYRAGQPRLELDLSQEGSLHLFADEEIRRLRPAGAPPRFEFSDPPPRKYYCAMPWYSGVVTADGSVYPCCMMMQRPLGNILREPWEAIWNGARYAELRRELRDLMLLGGGLEYSRKYHPMLELACLGSFGCQWSSQLCAPDFYEALAARMAREAPRSHRLRAQLKNQLLRAAHRLLRRKTN